MLVFQYLLGDLEYEVSGSGDGLSEVLGDIWLYMDRIIGFVLPT